MISSKPIVTIVILTYNSKDLLFACLDHLLKLKTSNFLLKIIVVDNGSTEAIVKLISSKYPGIIVIENQKNYGFAKGVNSGIKLALLQGTEYVLLLNYDVEFPDDFLTNLVNETIKNNYLISGPKIISSQKKIWSTGGIIDKKRFSGGLINHGQTDKTLLINRKVDFISGTAMLINKEVFDKVGFFDESYFLYYEDVDFCYRASRSSIFSYFIPKSEIIHMESSFVGKNSPLHYYYALKSHFVFVLKRAPLLIKIREFIRLGKTVQEIIREKDLLKKKSELLAVGDFFRGKFGRSVKIERLKT